MSKSDETKWRLATALNELVEQMPYDQVTVSAVARKCGMTRQAFYYHFGSLDQLTSWTVHQRLLQTMASSRGEGWQTKLVLILNELYERREPVMRVMASADRSRVDRLIKDELGLLAMRMVEGIAGPAGVPKADMSLIARFYSAGTAEIIEAWIDDGMRERPERLAHRLDLLFAGGTPGLIKLFGTQGAKAGA